MAKKPNSHETIGCVLVLVVIFLLVVAFKSSLIIYPAVLRTSFWVGVLTSAVLLVYLFLVDRKKTSAQPRRVSKKKKDSQLERVVVSCVGAILISAVVTTAVSFGVPPVLHFFSSHKSEVLVTVESKRYRHKRSRRSPRCGYSVRLKEKIFVTCGLSREFYNSLPDEGPVFVNGRKSIFGFSFDKSP